jgi:hypothetical protein
LRLESSMCFIHHYIQGKLQEMNDNKAFIKTFINDRSAWTKEYVDDRLIWSPPTLNAEKFLRLKNFPPRTPVEKKGARLLPLLPPPLSRVSEEFLASYKLPVRSAPKFLPPCNHKK